MSGGRASRGPRFLAGALVVAASFASAPAQAPAPHTVAVDRPTLDPDTAVNAFAALSKKDQVRVLEAIRSAVANIDDPYLIALKAQADNGRDPGKARRKPIRGQRTGGKSSTSDRGSHGIGGELPFQQRAAYGFGYGTVGTPQASRRSSRSTREKQERMTELRSLLTGHPVDVDLALAGMLRSLDNQRAVDDLAVFLDCWRDGDRPFYDSLQSTAGTARGVFHFDAMFDDWLRHIVPKDHPDRKHLRKSHDAVHTAFHQAFRNYWRYRSLRETLALTMLLPPDAPLPSELARFENNGGNGGYSTRDTVFLMLAAHGGDPAPVIEAFLEHAPPVPADLWTEDYQPYGGLSAAFQAMMPKMHELAGHTDELLARAKGARVALRGRIAAAAEQAFLEALPDRQRKKLANRP